MIRFGVSADDHGLRLRLKKLKDGVSNRKALHAAAGHVMVNDEIPQVFREGKGWSRLAWRQGEPLKDTGALRRSISYRASSADVRIGSPLLYARLQDRGSAGLPGGVVRPVSRKWLAIPLSPPLTVSERRVKRPRDFPGAFVLMKGPEGPGLYRKSRGGGAVNLRTRRTTYRGKAKGVERIFAFVKSVRIPARPFLFWSARALEKIRRRWEQMLQEGLR